MFITMSLTILGIALAISISYIYYLKDYSKKSKDNLLKEHQQELEQIRDQISQENLTLEHCQEIILNKKEELNTLEETEKNYANTLKEKYALEVEKEYKKLQNELKEKANAEEAKCEEAIAQYQQEYLNILESNVKEYTIETEKAFKAMNEAVSQLAKEQQLVKTAVEARKRKEEEENKILFYMLQIPKKDLEDIQYLEDVADRLNNPEVLYKTIWKVYYEKPYNDLIGRVIGDVDKCGIYKITNTLNDKSYIGQSVSIKERWRQHIKRGCGAEAPTRNKLYSAMLEDGVWNFSFELLEECPREELDEKEDFWQKYFDVITYGYSIK